MNLAHIPVLLDEVIDGLNLKKDSFIIDATVNGGGHTRAFLNKVGKSGRLIGLDWDPKMVEARKAEFADDPRASFIKLNFREIRKLARSSADWRTAPDAIFFDLGLSSLQLDARQNDSVGLASGRGFSFQTPETLDMTFEPGTHPDLKELLEKTNEEELANIIFQYGEERKSRKIARAIKEAWRKHQIANTFDLGETIRKTIGRHGKIHPATKSFQAFRIYLNHEIENLEVGLKEGYEVLKPGGRLAVISFHSLEDRIVKNFFRAEAKEGRLKILTKKPIIADLTEITENPRARSAKLRVAEKL